MAGRTPLHCAAIRGTPAIIEMVRSILPQKMLGNNRNLDTSLLSSTALLDWMLFMTRYMQQLVEAGAYVGAQDDAGRTPLAVAAMEGQIFTVEALLDVSADPFVLDM